METEIIEIKNTEPYLNYARIRDYLITSLMLSTRVLEKELVLKLCKYSELFNPIPAGVLENQDTLGGVNLTPPPLNPMFYVQI